MSNGEGEDERLIRRRTPEEREALERELEKRSERARNSKDPGSYYTTTPAERASFGSALRELKKERARGLRGLTTKEAIRARYDRLLRLVWQVVRFAHARGMDGNRVAGPLFDSSPSDKGSNRTAYDDLVKRRLELADEIYYWLHDRRSNPGIRRRYHRTSKRYPLH